MTAELLALDAALALLAERLAPVAEAEDCGLDAALGRVTAMDIIAPRALPPFTNTGVDGYAFRHRADRTQFRLAGGSFAGSPFDGTLDDGQAARIATGAVLPAGADTVAMQEDCRVADGTVEIDPLPPMGANIRHAGADIAVGSPALPRGRRLQPQDIALLGALGCGRVGVIRTLRVAVASTGAELVAAGMPLAPGQVSDTNGLMLAQAMHGLPVDVTLLPALPDDYDATAAALRDAADRYDLIVTTGGVSVGDRDFVRDALRDLGDPLFWKLAIRPGKPVMAGRIGRSLVIGLPGNPVSALVTFFLIVRPALALLWGGTAALPPAYPVRLAGDLTTPGHLRCFVRARIDEGVAVPFPDQSSNLFTSLTASDGLLDLPIGAGVWRAGQDVLFRPWRGLF